LTNTHTRIASKVTTARQTKLRVNNRDKTSPKQNRPYWSVSPMLGFKMRCEIFQLIFARLNDVYTKSLLKQLISL